MNGSDHPELQALQQALSFSPENFELRKLLARALAKYGYHEAAGKEFREALRLNPGNLDLILGLAQCFAQLGMDSEAAVALEGPVEKEKNATPEMVLLYARLLARQGELAKAATYYHELKESDPNMADEELDERLAPLFERFDLDGDPDALKVRAGESSEGFAGDLTRPKVTFKDVGGMEAVKEEIRMKIIHPLQHPELYKAYGKKIGGGILLYGPPGCGKTHLARATAGEVNASFIAVGISDVLDMWIGSSERNLHQLFEQARDNRPCVLFFDEVDALGASRTDMRQSASRQLINQFLSELDGIDTTNEGILVLAATNAPWHLDSAFRRPGRFDRILFVPPPDEEGRAAVLRVLLQGKPADNVDFRKLAAKTDAFSGADMKAVVDIAIEEKLREAMKKGIPSPLTTSDLISAARIHKATTREWFSAAKNYALYANQGGLYDDVLTYLKLKR